MRSKVYDEIVSTFCSFVPRFSATRPAPNPIPAAGLQFLSVHFPVNVLNFRLEAGEPCALYVSCVTVLHCDCWQQRAIGRAILKVKAFGWNKRKEIDVSRNERWTS